MVDAFKPCNLSSISFNLENKEIFLRQNNADVLRDLIQNRHWWKVQQFAC